MMAYKVCGYIYTVATHFFFLGNVQAVTSDRDVLLDKPL